MSDEQQRRNDAFAAKRHAEHLELLRLARLGSEAEIDQGAIRLARKRHTCDQTLSIELGVPGDIYRFNCRCGATLEINRLEAACSIIRPG